MPGNQAEKRAVSQIKPPRPTRTTRMCFSLRCGIIEKPWKSSLLRSCEPLHGGFVCQRTSCYLLSYSHDSDDHAGRVVELADALCGGGIDVILGQYVDPAPEEGWPRW